MQTAKEEIRPLASLKAFQRNRFGWLKGTYRPTLVSFQPSLIFSHGTAQGEPLSQVGAGSFFVRGVGEVG